MIVIFIVPVVLALSLCLLPTRRQAATGIGVTAAVLLVLWFASGGVAGEGLTGSYVLMAAPGVALAALAHLTHRILGPRLPVWGYALAAVVVLVAISVTLNAVAGN